MQEQIKLVPETTPQVEYVQQLISTLTTQPAIETENLPYDERHRSIGALDQDNLMSHIELWLKDRTYLPEGFSEKKTKRFLRLVNRFLLFNEKIYRRGQDSHMCRKKEGHI